MSRPINPGAFQPGQSGNPAGKPRGARNRTTRMLEELLEGEAQDITRKAIELAKSGDGAAIRLCLERLIPARRDRPVPFEMPKLEGAADAVKASRALVEAVAAGDLTPSEAMEISRVVESFTKAVETADLEVRLDALEQSLKERT